MMMSFIEKDHVFNGNSQYQMTQIFDNGPWDLPGGADHLVSHFDYLNSSERDEAARVRAVVGAMFERFPTEAQDGLRNRLRSIDNITHLAAFFELALHELLIRSGCTILAVEPDLEGTERSPDFHVESAAGERFYLEATLATGRSQTDQGADRRLSEALQAIDSVHSPDFFLDLHVTGVPREPVSGRRLRRRLEAWLQSLEYDDVVATLDDENGVPPSFRYEQHGVRFVISPVPRVRSRGTETHSRAIGSRMLAPLSVQPQEPIRNAILGKAGRYGDLDEPYIVAVNAMSDYADADSVVDALFGTPGVSVRHTKEGFEEWPERVRDGAWFGHGGPTNTRVSGVLSTERLHAWSLGQRRARLVLNPWAQQPLGRTRLPFTTDIFQVRDNRIRKEAGASIREILELPEGWPE